MKLVLKEFRRRLGVWSPDRFSRDRKGECGWATFLHGYAPINHTSVINHLALSISAKRYLEIGVRKRSGNLDEVLVPYKLGVDPNPNAGADHVCTSDDFFSNYDGPPFDLIFIDGLHTGEQVEKDLRNSLSVMSANGAVVLHDLNPPTQEIAREDSISAIGENSWCGTCWRGYMDFRRSRDDLSMCVVDTDWGCGIVRWGEQEIYSGDVFHYEDLAKDRFRALNLLSVRDFLDKYPVSPFDRFKISFRGSAKE